MSVCGNKELTEQLIAGQEEAYAFLLDHYHRRLYAYALTLVGDPSGAQDIVQNVFIKTWKFREKLDPDLSLQNFLYTSVYNTFVNHYQKEKSAMVLQLKYLEALQEVVEESGEEDLQEMMRMVNAEIKNLPPKCQQIFVLSKKEGLANTEISAYLNVSIKTVESQITKAFRILRLRLGEQYKAIILALVATNIRL